MPNKSIVLNSISLLLDEPALFKGPSLASLLPTNDLSFKMQTFSPNQENLSPLLTFMPEVFHRRLLAYSKPEFIIVNHMYRLVEMLRYNFSNGVQVSAKEILRHPLHKYVADEYLPQHTAYSLTYGDWTLTRWPLVQNDAVSEIRPLEEIMQALLNRLASAHRQKKLTIFLQTHSQTSKSLKVENIEFDPGTELDWRVDFEERNIFESNFKLVSNRKQRFYFFNSFAIEPESRILVVHPWLSEFSQLQEKLSTISNDLFLQTNNGMPSFELTGESKTKALIKHLRTRNLPVNITGESYKLNSNQSQTEVHLDENGFFTIQHEARVLGQKNIIRKGWSERTVHYLLVLSQGLPIAFNSLARDMATNDEFKREWDLSLLKHLGILQYIFFESLSVYYTGLLSDGTSVSADALWPALDHKIKLLLTSNQIQPLNQTGTLEDLCSKSVLSCFEKWLSQIFLELTQSESFYSEYGEVTMDGIVQREFRLLYLMLCRQVTINAGSNFNKIRVPLLSRISATPIDSESSIAQVPFWFSDCNLQSALEILQPIIPFGFKLFLKNRPIQELGEKDLNIDFEIRNTIDQSQINWFELSPRFFLMGKPADPDQFLNLGVGGVIEYENNLFLVHQSQMPSLRLLEEFWRKLQKGKEETNSKPTREKIYQLPRSQTLFLLALRKAGIPFRGDEGWDRICTFYDKLGQYSGELKLPRTINAELKQYQKQGVQWLQDLYNLRLGALLADDMGLGKTVQTLSFLEDLRVKDEMGPVLIVLPSSLIYNWVEEIQKFTPKIPILIFTGEKCESVSSLVKNQGQTVVLITYGLLLEHAEVLARYEWNIVVFDEAQNLKNISAKRTSAARSIKARFKLALTGTPMENHYGEFYSLIDLLVPGSLGPIENFRSQYVNSPTVDYEAIKDLKLKIKPLVLRRTKKEILDQLPEKQETIVKIAFEEQQKEIYKSVALSYNIRIQEAMSSQGTAHVQLQMFTALLRLRQVCSDPTGLPEVTYDKTPPKLETLRESLEEIVESGESALVFTQFLQTLEHTKEILTSAGLPVFVIHGGVTQAKRQKTLAEFNLFEKGAILLMTLKTGGVGLNLTKASYVFHIEPWWNPAVENQATDRAHRMGQTKPVHVFKYIMHESLEEKIEILKARKDGKFQSLFSDSESHSAAKNANPSITKDDFDRLVEL